MNFLEALKTELPMRRPNRSFKTRASSWETFNAQGASTAPWAFKSQDFIVRVAILEREDYLATDWEVEDVDPRGAA